VNYQIVLHPDAEKEYQEAYLWYEEQVQGLGVRFEKAVENRLNQIITKPQMYPKKRGVFREVKIETFPYVIVYKIYARKRMVFISAVYHASRNPRRKYRR
jgi:plasmid stabilization system protein ParE